MRHLHRCIEELLLAQGLTVVQLGELVFAGLAKIRAAGRQKVVLVTITEIGWPDSNSTPIKPRGQRSEAMRRLIERGLEK